MERGRGARENVGRRRTHRSTRTPCNWSTSALSNSMVPTVARRQDDPTQYVHRFCCLLSDQEVCKYGEYPVV
jgi:hypothetical protein